MILIRSGKLYLCLHIMILSSFDFIWVIGLLQDNEAEKTTPSLLH